MLDDGAIVIGQPDVAATWIPVNDHPIDKASYTFKITAPADLEVIANGVLKGEHERHGWKTWTWDAREPMASYLATMRSAVRCPRVPRQRHQVLGRDPDL